MARFDELLLKLQEKDIKQTGCWDDDLYGTELWEEYFENTYEEVASDLEVDKRRWYELSTTVLKIYGRYLGIHMISDTKGDTYIEDCSNNYRFFEMEEVKTITYQEM